MSALFTALVEGETKEALASSVVELRSALIDIKREAAGGGFPKGPYRTLSDIARRAQRALNLTLGDHP